MNNLMISNCRLFNGEIFHEEPMDILIEDGIIAGIGIAGKTRYPGYAEDARGRIVCPGYVDIHTHGMGGFDNTYVEADKLDSMARVYHYSGTTTFVPTIPTVSDKNILRALEMYSRRPDLVPGVHLEGPFINIGKKGAQNPVYILNPLVDIFKKITGDYRKVVIRVSLAPEKDKDFKLTQYLVSENIKVSFGHTECDSETANAFFDITDAIATHMFNAMPSIHHRKPMITTVALNRDNVMCEIIPDLIHTHPEIIKLIYNVKGAGKTIIISDSMLAAGLGYGEYDFSGLHVTVSENGARLDSGILAGSIATIADGVRNITGIGVPPGDVLASATSSPARAMGLENICGHLKKGRTADILILADDYSVSSVFKSGEKIR
ncbi:MAG: N-acetylglucosamine-6-phosphate deacetylase [Clostridia bacterium]|nr:N-acetylglucosamine-6-phosphate deacetylase [Clostridia bacterium]